MNARILLLYTILMTCCLNALPQTKHRVEPRQKNLQEVDMSSLPGLDDALRDVAHMSDSLKLTASIIHNLFLDKQLSGDVYLKIYWYPRNNPNRRPSRILLVEYVKSYCNVGNRVFAVREDNVGLKTLKRWKTFHEDEDYIPICDGPFVRWGYIIKDGKARRVSFEDKRIR